MTPRFPVASRAVFSAASTASKPELQKMVFPTLDFGPWTLDHFSNVSALNSRASRALSACGCTSPMACSSVAIWRWPARTTRGLAWPAAATPKAAVRSRYLRPSASQTFTPRARSHTMGHEPSASMNVTLRDSWERKRVRVDWVLVFKRAEKSQFQSPAGVFGDVPELMGLPNSCPGRALLSSARRAGIGRVRKNLPTPHPGALRTATPYQFPAASKRVHWNLELGVCLEFEIWSLEFSSHPSLLLRPHKLVHLQLETHRQRVGDNFLREFAARDRRLAGGNFLE